MRDWLAHPLSLLIVGAAVSSLVVPALTRGWQDHQKELEVKTNLVSEIAEAATRFFVAVQFAELRAASQRHEDFDAAYRDWEVKSAVIASKLRAYFPGRVVEVDWEAYTAFAARLYTLATATGKEKELDLERLQMAILALPCSIKTLRTSGAHQGC